MKYAVCFWVSEVDKPGNAMSQLGFFTERAHFPITRVCSRERPVLPFITCPKPARTEFWPDYRSVFVDSFPETRFKWFAVWMRSKIRVGHFDSYQSICSPSRGLYGAFATTQL
jgi:hypothetical protein